MLEFSISWLFPFVIAKEICLNQEAGATPCISPKNLYHLYTASVCIYGTHQLLAYANDVNILRGSIHTLKENTEALVAATREIGLEVSADKTKYMVMSRDQNAGQNHRVRIDNSTFERVEEFKYLGTTLTN